jgi:hypothetical protein
MRSNSKLTPYQKAELVDMKLTTYAELVNNGETTIAYKERGNIVEFSMSVMSPNEKKFRRKVGEYFALIRFDLNQTVKMSRHDFFYMLGNTFYIAI